MGDSQRYAVSSDKAKKITENITTNFTTNVDFAGFDVSIVYKMVDKKINDEKTSGRANAEDYVMGRVGEAIYVGLTRGTNFASMLKRSKKEGVDILMEMKNYFGLVDKVSDTPKSNEAINLSRMVNAFPVIAAYTLKNNEFAPTRRPVSLSEAKLIMPEYPKELLFTSFSSLIPKTLPEEEIDMLKFLLEFYSAMENRKLDKKNPKTFKEACEFSITFIEAGYKSNAVSDELRASLAIEWDGVFKETSKGIRLTEEVVTSYEHAMTHMKHLK